MASVGAIWGPATLRLLRVAVAKTTKAVRIKLADAARPLQGQTLQHAPIPVKSGYTGRQPIPHAALLRQQRRGSRWFSSAAARNIDHAVRSFLGGRPRTAPRLDRFSLPSSSTSRRVAQFSGRAPFSNALRPNLTGGALPRTAGGYSLGGGARYFSHSPAAPAQVVQNVSQAMRAFFLSGQRIRYDGVGPRGGHCYRAVSVLEDGAMRSLAHATRSAPGAFIDFPLNPTITALSPLAAAVARASESSGFGQAKTLHDEGFLDVLAADFGRALQDLKAVDADLRRLSGLGDLPITLEKGQLRVLFPGVDALTVERLCDDIGIQRGVVGQDGDFDSAVGASAMLKLPFAPDSPGDSARSLEGHELEDSWSLEDDSFLQEAFATEMEENPWLSEPEGYGSMSGPASSGDFEGLEGIYRFLEECDRGRGRLG